MEGMRGVSAALVFFVHFNGLFGGRANYHFLRDALNVLGTLGVSGVDVFFVLSGYIIHGILMKGSVRYGQFLRRRIVRLYPVFLTVFLIYLVASIAYPAESRLPHSFPSLAVYLAINLMMLPGVFPMNPFITVAWSLSYELCFYLTQPVLIRVLQLGAWPRRPRLALLLVLSVAFPALSAGVFSASPLCHVRLRHPVARNRPLEDQMDRACRLGRARAVRGNAACVGAVGQ
ncbi:MAG TPA: acyltransferase [Candidatus Sulfopaludibacter sp.]|nr:acyltransferase [Candidatus Sulfopaludibacter sp.]